MARRQAKRRKPRAPQGRSQRNSLRWRRRWSFTQPGPRSVEQYLSGLSPHTPIVLGAIPQRYRSSVREIETLEHGGAFSLFLSYQRDNVRARLLPDQLVKLCTRSKRSEKLPTEHAGVGAYRFERVQQPRAVRSGGTSIDAAPSVQQRLTLERFADAQHADQTTVVAVVHYEHAQPTPGPPAHRNTRSKNYPPPESGVG
jgi:hypothetical protein